MRMQINQMLKWEEEKAINDYWDRLLVRKNVSIRHMPYIGKVSTVADESITTIILSLSQNVQHQCQNHI